MSPILKRAASGLSLLAALALTGCGSMASDDAGRGPGGVPVYDQAMASQIPPGGAKINYAQSLIIGSGDNWMGRLVVELSQGSNAAYNFFLEQYPQQGWTLVSSVRGKSSLLVFTKADRSATVEITDGAVLGGALATLTVTPRSALPSVPARKP